MMHPAVSLPEEEEKAFAKLLNELVDSESAEEQFTHDRIITDFNMLSSILEKYERSYQDTTDDPYEDNRNRTHTHIYCLVFFSVFLTQKNLFVFNMLLLCFFHRVHHWQATASCFRRRCRYGMPTVPFLLLFFFDFFLTFDFFFFYYYY